METGQVVNPAQQQVLEQLGSRDRPQFRTELRTELRHELEEAFQPMLATVDPAQPLFVSKRTIGLVHSCEQHYVSDAALDFSWTVPTARGRVAHKAIELLIGYRGHPTPLDLIDAAMARLEADRSQIGDFLLGLDEGERAELIGTTNDLVTTFVETFPPLQRQWGPVAEASVRAEFGDGRIQLYGKVDLQLGYARGVEAGKVTIDLKTGRSHHSHVDDLRFYALLDTLKSGTPPRLLVSYYLDAGTPHTEAVTEELLWTAARRAAEAVAKICELQASSVTPSRTPSASCTFCPMNNECGPGREFMADRQRG